MDATAHLVRRLLAALTICAQLAVPVVAMDSRATAGTTFVRSGRWLVAPVLNETSPNPGAGLLINSLSTKKNSYFWARNFGNVAVQSFTIAQTVAITGRSPSVEIRACTGTWDVVRDTCSGTIVVLLSTADGQTNSAVAAIPLPVGGAVQLAAYPTKNGMTTTISASVNRSSVRASRILHG